MPRRPRLVEEKAVFHVLNRAAKRVQLFRTADDYAAFERMLFRKRQRYAMSLLCYSIMPNHWHFVLQPSSASQLSRFMQSLTTQHAQHWQLRNGSVGSGVVYQGRYKAIPVQQDGHFLTLCRYVERNALRAGLVTAAEEWRWSSAWRRANHCACELLDDWPVPLPVDWSTQLNRDEAAESLKRTRMAIASGRPVGDHDWTARISMSMGLPNRVRSVRRNPYDPTPDETEPRNDDLLQRIEKLRPDPNGESG